MKIPLHLSPDDKSPEAQQKRYDLHQYMMTCSNGRGWRIPPKNGKPINRYAEMLGYEVEE